METKPKLPSFNFKPYIKTLELKQIRVYGYLTRNLDFLKFLKRKKASRVTRALPLHLSFVISFL